MTNETKTLEELIEACGANFEGFQRAKVVTHMGEWIATSREGMMFAYGMTPREAVSKLLAKIQDHKS